MIFSEFKTHYFRLPVGEVFAVEQAHPLLCSFVFVVRYLGGKGEGETNQDEE